MKMFRSECSLSFSLFSRLSLSLSLALSLSLSQPRKGCCGCCMTEGCRSGLAFALVLLLIFVTCT